MRFYEVASGLSIPVDTEEQEILNSAVENQKVYESSLDERQQYVANRMMQRDILLTGEDDDGVYYIPNDSFDLWRF